MGQLLNSAYELSEQRHLQSITPFVLLPSSRAYIYMHVTSRLLQNRFSWCMALPLRYGVRSSKSMCTYREDCSTSQTT